MIEAAKTTASAGEIWLICIVAVACLAFWLSMVAWADRHPIWRGRQVPEMQGPVLGGMHVGGGGRSVAPSRDAPAVLTGEDEKEYEQSSEHEMAAADRPRVPGQREPQSRPAPEQAGATRGRPAQRTGEADRPEHRAGLIGGGEIHQGG